MVHTSLNVGKHKRKTQTEKKKMFTDFSRSCVMPVSKYMNLTLDSIL
jgi:hypothetical protein